jgi:prophage endopeptidase
MTMPTINLTGWLAIFLAAMGIGWALDHWALSAEASALQAQQQALEATLATERAVTLSKLRTIEGDNAITVATLSDQLHQAEAQNEKLERDRDTAIAAGARRVYVRASCPSSAGGATTPATAGGSHATGAELDPAYRPTLSELRRGVTVCRDRLNTLQAWATETMAALGKAAAP